MAHSTAKFNVTTTWTEVPLNGATTLTLQNRNANLVTVAFGSAAPAADYDAGLQFRRMEDKTFTGLSTEKVYIRTYNGIATVVALTK